MGNPRFINPVLALSEADKNLTILVYSGLMRLSHDGEYQNDLAYELDISDDGLLYTARLRPDATFHDGMPVTADDVIFTIQRIVDPLTKSPKRGNWENIDVENY
jgi:peptide/nickel transport system substrate-binding protein